MEGHETVGYLSLKTISPALFGANASEVVLSCGCKVRGVAPPPACCHGTHPRGTTVAVMFTCRPRDNIPLTQTPHRAAPPPVAATAHVPDTSCPSKPGKRRDISINASNVFLWLAIVSPAAWPHRTAARPVMIRVSTGLPRPSSPPETKEDELDKYQPTFRPTPKLSPFPQHRSLQLVMGITFADGVYC
ncbi:hypothetical protein J6590_029762 [Homalodisca vitripennis]|nr:hypothetical protein J6590_029762 [Homalodisca vitripennis]